jgi:hypothetical protein
MIFYVIMTNEIFNKMQRSGSFRCYIVYYYCLMFHRSGSCCCCYIVYNYCLRIERWVIHVTVGYIVYYFCLRFDRGVVHVVILSIITVLGLTEEWFMLLMLYCLPLLIKVCQMSGSCCCFYIIYYCCLRFGRREFHVVVVIFSTNAL